MPHVAVNNLYLGYNPSADWQEASETEKDTASTSYKPANSVINLAVCSSAYEGKKYYLWCLDSNEGEITLSIPLEVMIYHGVDNIIVMNEDFNITGVGDSREEALKDFEDFFIHDYIVYLETPDEQLDDNSKALLNKYRRMINNFESY